MHRILIAAVTVVIATASAHADADSSVVGSPDEPAEPEDDEIGDQAIGADVGIAGGSRVTPGGLRIAGHYLYQMSDQDWFDGSVAFTYGGGDAQCFRDRMDTFVCDHGFTDGASVEISASVRRVFAPRGQFRPFARAGIGVGLVRFSDDDVSGLAIPLHAGGGVRARVAPGIAVVAQADVQLGLGLFGSGLGAEPQFGMAVTAGAEFRLR
jgi:opacity protein-like surface antigen